MGFFGVNGSTSNVEDLLHENGLNTYEGLSIMEASYASMAATEMNWNAIMEAAAYTEMNYYANTGREFDVFSEAGSGFFSSVKELFEKIWNKIKALFKKFMIMLGRFSSDDKKFATKYASTIRKLAKNIPDGATIKGYKYTIDDVCGKFGGNHENVMYYYLTEDSGAIKASKTELENDQTYDAADIADKCRGKVLSHFCNKTVTSADESELRTEVYEALRNGDSSPDELDLTDSLVFEALAELENSRETKKTVNKAYTELEKKFKATIKAATNIEKEKYKKLTDSEWTSAMQNAYDAAKNDTTKTDAQRYELSKEKKQKEKTDEGKVLSRAINATRTIANAYQTVSSLMLTASKERYTQCKKICVQVVRYKNKDGGFLDEGAYVSHSSDNDYFRNISLV